MLQCVVTKKLQAFEWAALEHSTGANGCSQAAVRRYCDMADTAWLPWDIASMQSDMPKPPSVLPGTLTVSIQISLWRKARDNPGTQQVYSPAQITT